MEIARLGEEALIRRIDSLLASSQAPHANVILGIGDDAALIRGESGDYQLLTTDQAVEGVHFQRDWATPANLGWKTLAINLSDIAAMGGTPKTALVSLSLPPQTDVAWVDAFYQGLAEAAAAHDVAIVGGDTTTGPVIAASVTIIGAPLVDSQGGPQVLLRSAAKVGDTVAVTGVLGVAAAGLRALQSGVTAPSSLIRAFLHPIPRVPEGWLLVEEGVQAAIDVSDGLISDLQRLCLASGLAAEIDVAQVPLHQDAVACFPQEASGMALTGGEDYELLFTAPPEVIQRIQARANVSVTAIGRVVRGMAGAVRLLDAEGEEITLPQRTGWRHF